MPFCTWGLCGRRRARARACGDSVGRPEAPSGPLGGTWNQLRDTRVCACHDYRVTGPLARRARAPAGPETRPAPVTASVSPGTGGARSGGSSSAKTPDRRGPRRHEGWPGRPAFTITKTSGALIMQDAASGGPAAARRRFRSGYHTARSTRPAQRRRVRAERRIFPLSAGSLRYGACTQTLQFWAVSRRTSCIAARASAGCSPVR